MTVVGRARRIADDVLFPDATAVDAADTVPRRHLDLLAGAGLYGVAVEGSFADTLDAIAAVAGGCLATGFVWLQHHGAALLVAGSPLRAAHLPDLLTGRTRAGIALSGLRSSDPLRIRRDDDGFVLDGTAAWVSGWGLVDRLVIAARDADDVVHWVLADDPSGTSGADATPFDLAAARASRSVRVRFAGHRVPADRWVTSRPFDAWAAGDRYGSAMNGALALGLAGRCARLLDPGRVADRLTARVADVRARLVAVGDPVTGTPADVPDARAAASQLALTAAAALVVARGSRGAIRGSVAERVQREAALLAVFASRPAIREALDGRLLGG